MPVLITANEPELYPGMDINDIIWTSRIEFLEVRTHPHKSDFHLHPMGFIKFFKTYCNCSFQIFFNYLEVVVWR